MTATADTFTSTNPVTGEVVTTLPVHNSEDVHAAVARARQAQQWWGELSFGEREKHLLRWASYLVKHADELTELIHRENGKPTEDAYLELVLTLEHIRWAAKNARKVLKPNKVSPGLLMANFAAVIEQRPHGVIGVIGPWNYPIYTPNGSVAYALAAGNAVVFKPSEFTPAIGQYYADAFGLANPEAPAGVLQTVTGAGSTGAALVDAGVDKVAFTGSTATGKKIMAAAAQTLTPVLLECGGKDALIVDDDADVPAAAEAAAWGAMANSGQTCVGVERVYVTRAVREEFLSELTGQLKGITPGADGKAAYGPMTMPGQVDVVRKHIDDALANGGTALMGGPESVRSPFVEPVVLVDVDESSDAVCEETFGPTVTVRTVADTDEAIRLTNASKYGLASTVFSRRRGIEIARQLRAGATSVNSVLAFAAISSLPFGGVGDSGIGRIHGAPGLLEFTRPHSIARQRFAVPGMQLLTFRRKKATMALVKRLIRLRHG